MNVIFHFIFNYLFVDAVFGNAWDYLLLIFLSSVLIDLTHLPYLLKVRGAVVKKRFGSGSRTRFHEMYGLTVFSFILWLSFFLFGRIVAGIAAMCLVLHFAIDFIAGKSMPFYPYSEREVSLGMLPYGYKEKILFETGVTIILGVLFWLKIQSFVL